ncbi:FAD-binding domain-containing protein [Hyphobacterium sp.]|uniref:FAD-binding domain-containing protein n=1 Tax=Hyphobacterium sp. TaxID=2004662 RepID=UPI003BAA8647
MSVTFEPTRATGLDRLDVFLDKAGHHYAINRNTDFGPLDRSNISCLSPWLRSRVLTETELLFAVLDRHGYQTAEKFIQEVAWRGYFKGWLEHRPGVWDRYQSDLRNLTDQLAENSGLRHGYETACSGRTGIDAFDAWVKELVADNYLHNHARMWFASIWIFTLKLPWQLGADFFMRHLLDGDPASNTLSWRWVGGLHTIGKTYLARADNIQRFTNGRFNPAGQLSTEAIPLQEPTLAEPVPPLLPALALPDTDYAWLLSEEDLSLPAGAQPKLILSLDAMSKRSPLAVDQKVLNFHARLRTDARQRHSQTATDGGDISTAKALIERLKAENICTVARYRWPTGPSAESWQDIAPKLERSGICVVEGVADYDRAIWPHASKGFFKVKKKLEPILTELGLLVTS